MGNQLSAHEVVCKINISDDEFYFITKDFSQKKLFEVFVALINYSKNDNINIVNLFNRLNVRYKCEVLDKYKPDNTQSLMGYLERYNKEVEFVDAIFESGNQYIVKKAINLIIKLVDNSYNVKLWQSSRQSEIKYSKYFTLFKDRSIRELLDFIITRNTLSTLFGINKEDYDEESYNSDRFKYKKVLQLPDEPISDTPDIKKLTDLEATHRNRSQDEIVNILYTINRYEPFENLWFCYTENIITAYSLLKLMLLDWSGVYSYAKVDVIINVLIDNFSTNVLKILSSSRTGRIVRYVSDLIKKKYPYLLEKKKENP